MRHEILELDDDDRPSRMDTKDFADVLREGVEDAFSEAMQNLPRTISRQLAQARGRILDPE